MEIYCRTDRDNSTINLQVIQADRMLLIPDFPSLNRFWSPSARKGKPLEYFCANRLPNEPKIVIILNLRLIMTQFLQPLRVPNGACKRTRHVRKNPLASHSLPHPVLHHAGLHQLFRHTPPARPGMGDEQYYGGL